MLNFLFLEISSTRKRKALFFFFLPGKTRRASPQLNPRPLERTSGSSSTWRPPRAWTWVRLRTNSPLVGRVFSVYALHGGCMVSLNNNKNNWKHGLLHSCNQCMTDWTDFVFMKYWVEVAVICMSFFFTEKLNFANAEYGCLKHNCSKFETGWTS